MFYQPSWRYQVLVQNFAADRMAAAVRELLGSIKQPFGEVPDEAHAMH